MPARFDRSQIPPAPDLSFEINLWQSGILAVAGVDEAGRGALAGPVAAGAVVLPVDAYGASRLRGVRDSKQMTSIDRSKWAERLHAFAIDWAVGFASAAEIDALGILPATRLAVKRALDSLAFQPGHLLVDFLSLPDCSLPQTALVKGDARSLSIAAASILAKTSRDKVMIELDLRYPGYGFAAHKGYGTAAHLVALHCLGPTQEHRRSFKVRQMETCSLLLQTEIQEEVTDDNR